MHRCVGHMAEGCEGRYQAGPKGPKPVEGLLPRSRAPEGPIDFQWNYNERKLEERGEKYKVKSSIWEQSGW